MNNRRAGGTVCPRPPIPSMEPGATRPIRTLRRPCPRWGLSVSEACAVRLLGVAAPVRDRCSLRPPARRRPPQLRAGLARYFGLVSDNSRRRHSADATDAPPMRCSEKSSTQVGTPRCWTEFLETPSEDSTCVRTVPIRELSWGPPRTPTNAKRTSEGKAKASFALGRRECQRHTSGFIRQPLVAGDAGADLNRHEARRAHRAVPRTHPSSYNWAAKLEDDIKTHALPLLAAGADPFNALARLPQLSPDFDEFWR